MIILFALYLYKKINNHKNQITMKTLIAKFNTVAQAIINQLAYELREGAKSAGYVTRS